MRTTFVILRRELASYFATPVAYAVLGFFLCLGSLLTFSRKFGAFFERNTADMQAFFGFLPVIFLVLIPAIAMRIWAEERRTGTVELLLTLPVTMGQAVLGKFLAAWVFAGLALLSTTPIWITVSILGDPDHGVIVGSYLGAFLMAGAFLAIGSCISALTKNQVVAFLVTFVACFLLIGNMFPEANDALRALPTPLVLDAVSFMSFFTHYESLVRGVLDMRDVVFFLSVTALFLVANAVTIDARKAT